MIMIIPTSVIETGANDWVTWEDWTSLLDVINFPVLIHFIFNLSNKKEMLYKSVKGIIYFLSI